MNERTFQQIIEVWIEPEIERRIASGLIRPPVALGHFQVIFHPDGERAPTVRINDEVRAVMDATVKFESIGPNGEVDSAGVSEIRGIYTPHDPNCGHITYWNIGPNKWYGAFSAVYNAERVAALLPTAQEFLASARLAKESSLWAPFIDNLHSAVELAAKCELWLSAIAKDFKPRMNHEPIRQRFRQWAAWGNVPAGLRETFDELVALRTPVRYGLAKAEPRWDESDDWFHHVEGLIAHVEDTVAAVRPPEEFRALIARRAEASRAEDPNE